MIVAESLMPRAVTDTVGLRDGLRRKPALCLAAAVSVRPRVADAGIHASGSVPVVAESRPVPATRRSRLGLAVRSWVSEQVSSWPFAARLSVC